MGPNGATEHTESAQLRYKQGNKKVFSHFKTAKVEFCEPFVWPQEMCFTTLAPFQRFDDLFKFVKRGASSKGSQNSTFAVLKYVARQKIEI
jgi:hypothetical protein